MPKHAYDEHYGALSIFPFNFSWISLLVMPFLLYIKDKETLKYINGVCYYLVYSPLSLLILAIFVVVNLILLPFAYLKTVLHKTLLATRYNSSSYLKHLFIYIVMGIPFLLCAQFSDAYRFMVHTYDTKPRQ